MGLCQLHESNINSAYNLISSKGLAVTINYKTPGAYDVNTGLINNTTLSLTGYAVLINNALGDEKRLSNSEVVDHDILITILLSSKGINTPYLNDEIVISGVSHTITRIKTISPNYDEAIIYIVELKR